MCGIFGLALKSGAPIESESVRKLLKKLYILSESRGKESAGFHIYLPASGESSTLKGECSASSLVNSSQYKIMLENSLNQLYKDKTSINQPVIALAHSRLVTNGTASLSKNNQPVRSGGVTMIHNGIIVNVESLWDENPNLIRNAQVDTEIIAAITNDALSEVFNPIASMNTVFSKIEGTASIAWVHEKSEILSLATNTGDLYFIRLPEDKGLIFASEKFILEQATKELCFSLGDFDSRVEIEWLRPNTTLIFSLLNNDIPIYISNLNEEEDSKFSYSPLQRTAHFNETVIKFSQSPEIIAPAMNEKLLKYNESSIKELRRCTRCILPKTFPFIEFDAAGVCSICTNYKPRYIDMHPVETKKKFIQSLEHYRRDGGADVLVPFSGGRDSSYGLHLIYKEFDLKPITFTYDWGMVTDLARRNIARICGQLGVQNILISADIKVKRDNIRKNVSAWLKKPDLGMIPLFMAGDKQFFTIVNQLKKQTGINLDLWCANPLENTDFKSAFCGISPDFEKKRVDYLSIGRKFKLATYYGSRFLTNPRYLNSSLLDTLGAFKSYYFEPRKDFYFIFDHFIWNEDVVNQTLLSTYDWETSPDSSSTWRIGDGSAPFYNYIYLTSHGFSEFDTFRSNQIREGMITREEALNSIVIENRPRIESLKWYLETIKLDFNSVISKINTLDRMELHR